MERCLNLWQPIVCPDNTKITIKVIGKFSSLAIIDGQKEAENIRDKVEAMTGKNVKFNTIVKVLTNMIIMENTFLNSPFLVPRFTDNFVPRYPPNIPPITYTIANSWQKRPGTVKYPDTPCW